jgi:hypothetical protein
LRIYTVSGLNGIDSDFGASPTAFGNALIGACNKNGYFYALHLGTMSLAFVVQVGSPEP